MANDDGGFPTREQVWRGALLGSIVHAIMLTRYPELSNEQSWDGTNYSVQDSMGSRGTIAFSNDYLRLVAVFFDDDSPRNPFKNEAVYDPNHFFGDMPAVLGTLAYDEALQYVLQEYQGDVKPIITAAFWGDDARLSAAEPWPDVFAHGAHLIRIQLMDTDEALAEWRDAYQMSPLQLALAKALFERKIASAEEQISLTGAERNMLAAEAEEDEGMEEALESLREIGIV